MARRTYTNEERERALALYADHGAAHASRETGIPAPTIRSMASRAGASLQRAETTAAATAAHQASAAERRQRLSDRLLEIAETAVDRTADLLADAPLRDVVGAWTRAVHDHQLLTGAATARTESLGDPKVAAIEAVDELRQRRERKAAG